MVSGYRGGVKRAWVLLVVSATALADPKTAAVHDRQAKAYFEAKQYDAAIGEFEKSYAQDKKPLTLFKIASAYYAKADFQKAIEFYQQYLQADPNGPYASQAIEFTTIAKKALDDKKAADDARVAAAEQEKKRTAAAGRIANAEAFAKQAAWVSAGDEYRAATEIDGDPAHLLDAGAAYGKQPDHAKASEAYRAYLDKVPSGGKSEEARTKLAESTRALQEEQAKAAAAEAERKRIADAQATKRDEPEKPKGPPPISSGISSFGPRVAVGLSQPDTNPLMMNSGQGLVAGPSFDVGAFLRYQLHARVAVRPEASLSYRTVSFDAQPAPMQPTINDALTIKRGGITVAVPLYVSFQETNGFRLGAGPFVSLLPYFKADHASSFPFDAGEGNKLDYGLTAGAEIDFGLVSIDVRFSKSFGTHAEPVDATMYTLLLGLTFGFEPARD